MVPVHQNSILFRNGGLSLVEPFNYRFIDRNWEPSAHFQSWLSFSIPLMGRVLNSLVTLNMRKVTDLFALKTSAADSREFSADLMNYEMKHKRHNLRIATCYHIRWGFPINILPIDSVMTLAAVSFNDRSGHIRYGLGVWRKYLGELTRLLRCYASRARSWFTSWTLHSYELNVAL